MISQGLHPTHLCCMCLRGSSRGQSPTLTLWEDEDVPGIFSISRNRTQYIQSLVTTRPTWGGQFILVFLRLSWSQSPGREVPWSQAKQDGWSSCLCLTWVQDYHHHWNKWPARLCLHTSKDGELSLKAIHPITNSFGCQTPSLDYWNISLISLFLGTISWCFK